MLARQAAVVPLFRQALCSTDLRFAQWKRHVSSDGTPSGPLEGIKVLDLGQVVAGNFCGALLGYFGADVIKVEPPLRGDALRSLRHTDDTGTSLWWRSYGRNRRCMTVDLHKEKGRTVVRQLAGHVDILVENFRPGVMEKWGLGPKDLSPALVYTRISGYGQTGPRAKLPGYASVCEAYGGFRHLNGFPGQAPVRPNISLGDSLAGLHAAFGAVMALWQRKCVHNGARGQVVDVAISECMFNMLEGCITEYVMHGHVRPPSGSTISGVVPSATHCAADGKYIVIGGNGDSIYTRLMTAVGRPDMGASNPLYANNTLRCQHEAEINEVIDAWVRSRTSEQIMEELRKAGVPAGPILSVADIYAEEQYKARDMFHTVSAPSGAPIVTLPAMVPHLSQSPGSTRWAGPELGEHTDEILTEVLGMSAEQIAGLRADGAI